MDKTLENIKGNILMLECALDYAKSTLLKEVQELIEQKDTEIAELITQHRIDRVGAHDEAAYNVIVKEIDEDTFWELSALEDEGKYQGVYEYFGYRDSQGVEAGALYYEYSAHLYPHMVIIVERMAYNI